MPDDLLEFLGTPLFGDQFKVLPIGEDGFGEFYFYLYNLKHNSWLVLQIDHEMQDWVIHNMSFEELIMSKCDRLRFVRYLPSRG
jgi:hypothetical protein